MHIVSIANGDHNDIENKTPYHETDIYYGTIFASYDNTDIFLAEYIFRFYKTWLKFCTNLKVAFEN